MTISITEDDLTGPGITALLQAHLEHCRGASPPESTHALDYAALREPGVTVWSARDDTAVLGCGALKHLDDRHGEIKSMHTAAAHRGKGVAARLLEHIIAVAQERAYQRLSLETGTMAEFASARALYARYGFTVCEPFADYREDPNSRFMTRVL